MDIELVIVHNDEKLGTVYVYPDGTIIAEYVKHSPSGMVRDETILTQGGKYKEFSTIDEATKRVYEKYHDALAWSKR